MIIVSDASPLISFAAIGHLDILRELYSEVLIPEAVYHEISVAGCDAPGAAEIESFDWIRVRTVKNGNLIESLSREVDSGEAAAIALATECVADFLLIDERRGRKVAKQLGQRVIGILGVLIEAKYQGHIPAVRPVLEELVTKAGFRVSQPLRDRVLQAAGESE